MEPSHPLLDALREHERTHDMIRAAAEQCRDERTAADNDGPRLPADENEEQP